MIFNDINNLNNIESFDKNIVQALKFSIKNDLLKFDNGKHEIDGDNIFFNRVSYKTKEDNEGFWEGHRAYIDIHLILSGKERIDYNRLKNLKFNSYVEGDDFASFDGDSKFSIVLEKGDFVIFYPDDIHKTGLSDNEKSNVEKVIFKMKL